MAYFWRVLNAFQRSALLPATSRVKLLRLFGCKVHPTARLAENIYIGSNKIYIEDGAFVNIGCFFDGSANVHVGRGVRVGPYVRILTGTHTYANNVMRRGPGSRDLSREVRIERGCWIGMGVSILPGVTIREGCVVGAGSVVVRDTDPNGLYVGNPAKRLRDLPVE